MRKLNGFPRWLAIASSLIAIGGSVYYIFHLTVGGVSFIDKGYLYFLMAFCFPLTFLYYPAREGRTIPWYDALAAVLTFAVPFYLFLNSYKILFGGWEIKPPTYFYPLGGILLLLILEGGRRVGGIWFAAICTIFGIYPLFASHMPPLLYGTNLSVPRMISMFTMGTDGITGIPLSVVGTLLFGFLVFAGALPVVKVSDCFANLAMALLGHVRGGPAKVSVVGSCLFGTISGSSIANVLTCGSITIPAMKKTGYPGYYAGAIEACASTGGIFMPPIMGAVAFVMAEFLGVPYTRIMIAAILPALLYYFCLFLQADAFAAKAGLRGLPRESLPPLWTTFKGMWIVLPAVAVLLYVSFVNIAIAQAPFYAAATLLLLALTGKKTRYHVSDLAIFIEESGKYLSGLVAILLPIGFIIGAISFTGAGSTVSAVIVDMAGGNLFLLLATASLGCLILGMGVSGTACYVVVAIFLAPAFLKLGCNPLASHLFVLYWSCIAGFTPPVAITAFAAAALAGAPPMKTAWQAMRIGIAAYFLPVMFVLNPALVFQGAPLDIILAFITCGVAIGLIAMATEGYMLKLGPLKWWLRPVIGIGGLLISVPGWITLSAGVGMAVSGVVVQLMLKALAKSKLKAIESVS